jgi:cytochrome c oxidase cbb3-type subunit 3
MSDDWKETPKKNVDVILHDYDGIQEYDNDLPRWWLYTLYATMVFGLGYWFWFHVFTLSPLPNQAYHQEMQDVYRAEAAALRRAGAVTPEALVALTRDDATVRQGREVFASTCVACHAANAGGGIGPNLTDDSWIHGSTPDAIYKIINEGFVPKGMAAWGPQLGMERVQAVTAFVLTLRNTNVAGGKAPQGERE